MLGYKYWQYHRVQGYSIVVTPTTLLRNRKFRRKKTYMMALEEERGEKLEDSIDEQ